MLDEARCSVDPSVNSAAGLENTIESAREIVQILMRGYSGSLAVRLWDKSISAGSETALCTLHIRSASILKTLIIGRDIIALVLVEDFLAERIDLEGDLESLFDAARHFEYLRLTPADKLRLFWLALYLPGSLLRLPSRDSTSANNRSAIHHHYDVRNAFYKFWLDLEMVYSSSYFADPDQSLVRAQQDTHYHQALCQNYLYHSQRALDFESNL